MDNNDKLKSLTRYDDKGSYDHYIGVVKDGDYVKFEDVAELFADLTGRCTCGGTLKGPFGYRYCETCFTAHKE